MAKPGLWWNVFLTGVPKGRPTPAGMGDTPENALAMLREDVAKQLGDLGAEVDTLETWRAFLVETSGG